MLRKISLSVLALTFFAFVSPSVFAQGGDDYDKVNVFAGFMHKRADLGYLDDSATTGFNGMNASFTGNFSRKVGAKFDFSVAGDSASVSIGTTSVSGKYRDYTFMGGIQVKDNAKDGSKVRPFMHALGGLARQTVSGNVSSSYLNAGASYGVNSFTMAVGGGIDVKVGDNLSVRIVQADYNPTFFRDQRIGTTTILESKVLHNVRFSFGVVFH